MNEGKSSNPLSIDIIVDKCKKQNLKEIKNINLWGSDIDDVSIIN